MHTPVGLEVQIVVSNNPVNLFGGCGDFLDVVPGVMEGLHSDLGAVVEEVAHHDDGVAFVFLDLLAEPINEVGAVLIVLLRITTFAVVDVREYGGFLE